MKHPRARSILAGIVALTLTGGALAGCASTAAESGPVELRWSWWGSDARHAATQEIIDLYESENPNVTIVGEFTDFNAYWDRLATSVAANDAPDIMQFDEMFLREYGDRGALMDIETMEGVDISEIDPAALDTGRTDAGLVGLSVGVTTPAIVANPAVLAAAGVEMPDDETWTWDDFEEISIAVSQSNPGAVWGAETWGFETAGLNVFARQNGESLYTTDGEVGVSKETLTDFWEMILRFTESGAFPSASVAVEEIALSLEQSGTATSRIGFGEWYSHNLKVLDAASGQELVLLRAPGAAEAEGSEYFKSAMYWAVSSRTQHPEEVAAFLDFVANDPRVGEILLAERGLPSNLERRTEITPLLEPSDQRALEFVDSLSGEVGDVSPIAPAGGGSTQAILQRYTTEVLFERMTPADAAVAFIDEVNANLK